jgi:hypothetical protein
MGSLCIREDLRRFAVSEFDRECTLIIADKKQKAAGNQTQSAAA